MNLSDPAARKTYRPEDPGSCPSKFQNMKPVKRLNGISTVLSIAATFYPPPCAWSHFDVKLQVFIHGIDVVKDVLHYPGDDSHRVCVMEISLHRQQPSLTARTHTQTPTARALLTSMVCVFPDDVWPYAKIVPLYPSKTSAKRW